MLSIQLIPRVTKGLFRVVVFVKDRSGKNIDADISLVAKLSEGKEIVFLMAPKSEKLDFVYPENSSKFLHRLEKGIYLAQSKNKSLLSVKEIVVRARVGNEKIEKIARL